MSAADFTAVNHHVSPNLFSAQLTITGSRQVVFFARRKAKPSHMVSRLPLFLIIRL